MRFKQILSQVLTGLLMAVTFGTFGAKAASNDHRQLNDSVAQAEAADRTQLDALKRRIKADYRDNIANCFSHDQAKGGRGNA